MLGFIFLVLVLGLSAQTVQAQSGADITVTPNPAPAGSAVHVAGCGFPRERDIIVRVGGYNEGVQFWDEFTVQSDGQGCVAFDTTIGAQPGVYGITFVTVRNNREHDVGYVRVTAT
jgi:hypothetical protein